MWKLASSGREPSLSPRRRLRAIRRSSGGENENSYLRGWRTIATTSHVVVRRRPTPSENRLAAQPPPAPLKHPKDASWRRRLASREGSHQSLQTYGEANAFQLHFVISSEHRRSSTTHTPYEMPLTRCFRTIRMLRTARQLQVAATTRLPDKIRAFSSLKARVATPQAISPRVLAMAGRWRSQAHRFCGLRRRPMLWRQQPRRVPTSSCFASSRLIQHRLSPGVWVAHGGNLATGNTLVGC
jgi:hypothetical protein